MWYEDDDELSLELAKLDKQEIEYLKIKQEQHIEQLNKKHQEEALQQEQEDKERLDNNSKSKNTVNNNNNNKMNNNSDRIISSSIDDEIRIPSSAMKRSSSPSPSPSPSPSIISSSQDAVFNIDDIQQPQPDTADRLPRFTNNLPQSTNNDNNNSSSSSNPLKKVSTLTPSTDSLQPPTPSSPRETDTTTTTTTTSSTSSHNNNNNNNNNNIPTIITSTPATNRGTRSLSSGSSVNMTMPKITTEIEKNIEEGKMLFCNFLKGHACYDVIPISGKVVVLDTRLVVKSAFYALEENGIKSAPLWSSELQDFTGMITVSDFIDILLYYYHKPKSDNIFQDMGIHRIETFWREIDVERPSSLISTEPETNLYEAASILLHFKIHRLPVVDKKDTNSILHILTHSRILAFMMKSLPQLPEKLLSIPIGSLGIGTFQNVVVVMTQTPLAEVLTLLSEKKISAVPIIDSETSKIVDVYSKSDVTLMAKQGVLSPTDLDLPVHQVLSTFTKLWQRPEQVYTCTRFDKLGDVIDKCLRKRVHRLVCIDSSKKVEGIISLSDILNYLLNVKK
ncbi:hypothetical protein CYY_006382 [Polysphondylium violaceum]|uniref:CBS domain-containing protein n=1 Tax=Polysphondylium violaceum TaxID=133409 RepID=A0A8J4PTK7_9MYCE|nr:hypothetical protein CYY_006382 [Polysphondylium violaceum]